MLHKGIAAIILGGLGDVRGAVLGGLFLGITEVFAVTFLSSEYRDALSFGLLFLMLLWRPQGLFGASATRSA
jgi:branched-chain amino acid transport system permease protein